jgi:apolipoprotein N-acyltransferase
MAGLAVRGPRALGLAALAGALAALGQAPLGLWPATVAGLAVLAWLVAGAGRPWRGFALGLVGGVGHFGLALAWLVEPFLIDVARHGWMAPFALALMAGGLALFWGAAGAMAAALRRPALAFAAALTAAELARGVVFTGFPWAMPGHALIGTPADQLAALAGAGGLTLLIALAGALPVAYGWRGTGAAALLLAAAWGGGLWRLAPPLPPDRGPSLRLVQPAAEQTAKWDPALARLFLDRQLALTARAPQADLTLWPETAVPWLMETSPDLAPAIAAAAGGGLVAVGIQRVEGERYWNALRLLSPGGEILATYDKHHLVPFGEYIPGGDFLYRLFGLRAFAARAGAGYSAGEGPRVLDLGPALGRVLPLICYEAIFPAHVRDAPARADWILQITNDAWFGTWSGPFQHMAQARLRAVESGLPLVRVANTGVTAVVDARGRVVAALPFGVPEALDAGLPGALPPPPYARWGDLPLWLLLAGLALWSMRRPLRAPP